LTESELLVIVDRHIYLYSNVKTSATLCNMGFVHKSTADICIKPGLNVYARNFTISS